jgi:hypothetical protein
MLYFGKRTIYKLAEIFSLAGKTLPPHLVELCKSYFGDPPYV